MSEPALHPQSNAETGWSKRPPALKPVKSGGTAERVRIMPFLNTGTIYLSRWSSFTLRPSYSPATILQDADKHEAPSASSCSPTSSASGTESRPDREAEKPGSIHALSMPTLVSSDPSTPHGGRGLSFFFFLFLCLLPLRLARSHVSFHQRRVTCPSFRLQSSDPTATHSTLRRQRTIPPGRETRRYRSGRREGCPPWRVL